MTVWSPQGRIHQVEYAMEAVKQGSATIGFNSKTPLWLWLHQNCLLTRTSSPLTLTWECQLQVWQLMLVFSAATCEQSAWTTDTPTTSPCLFLGSLETWEINCRFVHFPQLQTPNHYHTLRIFNQTIIEQSIPVQSSFQYPVNYYLIPQEQILTEQQSTDVSDLNSQNSAV